MDRQLNSLDWMRYLKTIKIIYAYPMKGLHCIMYYLLWLMYGMWNWIHIWSSRLGPVTRSMLVMIKCVFCDKFFYNTGTCVIIVVKPKYVNFGNMSNICGKLNFITNYTHVITIDTHLIKTHSFYNFWCQWQDSPLQDLRIS